MKHIMYAGILLSVVSLAGCNRIGFSPPNSSQSDISSESVVSSVESIDDSEPVEKIDLTMPTAAAYTDTVIEKTEDTSDAEDLSSFDVTYYYEDYFSISEKYYFTGSKYKEVVISFIPDKVKTLDEILDLCISSPPLEDFTEDGGVYLLTTEFGKPFLLPRIGNLQIDDAWDLAVETCDKITKSTDTGPGDKPWILGISKKYLAARNVSMHISSGEVRQIALSKCPEGYEDKLLFKSNNNAAVKVDKNGNVTGVKQGAATITISIDGLAVHTFVTVYVY